MAVIGIALALTIPMGSRWIGDYRFSATTRAMVNAAFLVRMNAIGGPITINIKQIAQGGTNKEFALVAADASATDDIVYTTPPYANLTTAPDYFPIQVNDYVTLTGFRTPDYVNGALFQVKTTSHPSPPTQVAGTTTQWSMPVFSFTCESCSELTPTNCIQWTGATPAPSDTGKVQVAASLKIAPSLLKIAYAPGGTADQTYTIEKSGNSVKLSYWRGDGTAGNRGAYTIKVGTRNPATMLFNMVEVSPGTVAPIVFDFAGATRGHLEYKIEIYRIKTDGTVGAHPTPVVFSILPSGRVRLGSG